MTLNDRKRDDRFDVMVAACRCSIRDAAVASLPASNHGRGIYVRARDTDGRSPARPNHSHSYATIHQHKLPNTTFIMSDSKEIPVVADKELASGIDAQAADKAAAESEQTGKIPQSRSLALSPTSQQR